MITNGSLGVASTTLETWTKKTLSDKNLLVEKDYIERAWGSAFTEEKEDVKIYFFSFRL